MRNESIPEQKLENSSKINLQQVDFNGDPYYKISNSNLMRPFFMSIVSDSNHWMFISSNGGLTAGRKNAEYALFPYYTDDKLTELVDTTGSKSIFQISKNGQLEVWEPFSERDEYKYSYTRNLYKNIYGNKILFEEINHDLELTFRYQWSTSNQFGFIRKSWIINDSKDEINIRLLDGIQDIMPYGVNPDLQGIRSNLVNAYKRNELEADSGLGVFALSAIIVDRAEPSEALKANIAWSMGLDNPTYLLSSLQLDDFRKGAKPEQEIDIKAENGSYFISEDITLKPKGESNWIIVANVNQTASSIAEISKKVKSDEDLVEEINEDIEKGTQELICLVSSSDGFQLTTDRQRNTRHYSNTLFNIMRGGIFDLNYQIEKRDFKDYLSKANKSVCVKAADHLDKLPDVFSVQALKDLVDQSGDHDLIRLSLEYMPLKFSRRHGDPSRPWNRFSINTRSEKDGSKILDYEGNWRDIFQNWEALAHSFPEFAESMISKFLNASTFDGYNPYRVTKDGFDWEIIEEHDPWSYIGYWGDHQIIYLLKFLEFLKDYYPDRLAKYFDADLFVYANVPYEIKPYSEILKNPKDTIIFDRESDLEIRNRRSEIGADGALLSSSQQNIHQVNFVEKILATYLAKLSNFIPEAGIWMNTQRPEWNDANNALVGNGVSVVTLCYLRRFTSFFRTLLAEHSDYNDLKISIELLLLFKSLHVALKQHQELLSDSISDKNRKNIMDALGMPASDYRSGIYENGFSGKKETLAISELTDFFNLASKYIDHSVAANERSDHMYHAYNLMSVSGNEVKVDYLDVMLEGQVAALSSGYLSPEEALALLNGMKSSPLFREDQYSYLLYPNKELPGFLERNIIPSSSIEKSKLLRKLVEDGNKQIIEKDIHGKYHFNGNFNNAASLEDELHELSESEYASLIEKEKEQLLQIFEEVFNHKAFTGRSGTFYGYEGLGSIYWHMVSKLLLAVQENCLKAVDESASDATIGHLLEHYYEIHAGIGVHKSPELYGAFPTDPYSHTPMGKGAQQPGMTGQVKEDILNRKGELGVFVKNGEIIFRPALLRASEFISEETQFDYINLVREKKEVQLPKNSLAFTYCQVPIIYSISPVGDATDQGGGLDIHYSDGSTEHSDELTVKAEISQSIFKRIGQVERIRVKISKDQLK
ncbi:MAG: hypothetical protein AAF363_06925 [Bacteroidota bacterium]